MHAGGAAGQRQQGGSNSSSLKGSTRRSGRQSGRLCRGVVSVLGCLYVRRGPLRQMPPRADRATLRSRRSPWPAFRAVGRPPCRPRAWRAPEGSWNRRSGAGLPFLMSHSSTKFSKMISTGLILLRLVPLFAVAHAGCTDGGHGGCGPPVGAKWDTWAMAASTYTYCYQGLSPPLERRLHGGRARPARLRAYPHCDPYTKRAAVPKVPSRRGATD